MQEISLRWTETARRTKENPPFLSVGSTSICIIVSEWPAISPANSSFCSGASASVVLDARVASLSLTDRLDHLLQLSSNPSSEDVHHRGRGGGFYLPAILSPVPRIVLNITFGNFSLVVCTNETGSEKPILLELETKGMLIQSSSSFLTGPTAAALPSGYKLAHDGIPLRMSMPFHCVLQPVFLRLRSSSTVSTVKRMSRWGLESTLSDTILSLDVVEVNGSVMGLGESREEWPTLATLDTRTLFTGIHCRAEAALIELWHPGKLEILRSLLSLLSPRRTSPITSSQSPPALPIGYSLSLSIARAVLFITGPDINPAADKDITRGIAFSTGVSLCMCMVGADHIHTVTYSQSESENRHKLFLASDRLVDAISFARVSDVPIGSVVFGKAMLWNTIVRSAAADGFSMDDPLVFERDNPSLDTKRIVTIRNINVDIKRTAQRSSSPMVPGYDASFVVDDFALFLELSLVYSALTTLQTIRDLQQCMASYLPSSSQTPRPPGANFTFDGTIKTVKARLTFLDQSIVTRVNHVDVSSGPRGFHTSIDSQLLWVPVLTSKVQPSTEASWEELGRLHKCALSGTSLTGRINVTMDSLRVRIPYGYVFAELSQAMVVTMKAIRHLMQMVKMGKYTPMPAPIAEDAKSVPDLVLACRILCLEADDDPFESRLAFNHRIGSEAARSRLLREEAFDAKAAAIVSGLSASHNPPSTHTDYQFDGSHSVTIQEARWRLDMAHSMDWILRHKRQSRERSVQEDSVFRQLYGSIPLKRPTQVPDLICPAETRRTPPLMRVMLSGLRLHLERPSFPLGQLPDFLYEQGSGLPHETLYSLLVPLHLSFALESLQVSLRDYPLPLLYIPPVAGGDGLHSLLFDSDLVVAEEMGPVSSVEWVSCPCRDPDEIAADEVTMLIQVPKTLMPVKTYARPSIQVSADDPVAFAWGVSYSPAMQDVVRMLESLTPEPRDPSSPLGFWDKVRT